MRWYWAIVFFGCFCISGIAQTFGEIGTKWHYSYVVQNPWSYQIEFGLLVATEQSFFQGKNCIVIEMDHKNAAGPGCSYFPYDTLKSESSLKMYEEDSAVYFWEWSLQRFEKLYSFKDSAWESSYVDWRDDENNQYTLYKKLKSYFDFKIGARTMKAMAIEVYHDSDYATSPWIDTVVYSLGSLRYPFFDMSIAQGWCDAGIFGKLRCYDSPSLGSFSTNVAPSCDYTNLSIEEREMEKDIDLFPNPFSTQVNLKFEPNDPLERLEILSTSGELVFETTLNKPETTVDLSQLTKGLYLVRVYHKEGIETKRIVKK